MTADCLGELLRTWHALEAHDDATRRAIRDLLCPELEWRPRDGFALSRREEPFPAPEPDTIDSEQAEPRVAAGPAVDRPADAAPAVVRFTARRGRPRAIEVPRSLPRLAADEATPPIEEPLLEPRWARSVLAAALAGRAFLGELDVPALTRTLATISPLRWLPRRPSWTLRTGVQVLVDRRPGMMVYFAEQSAVARQVEAVVGRQRTTVLRCDGFPPKQVSGLREIGWREYQEPAPGVPVLLISDLGISRGGLPAGPELENFLCKLAARNSPVTALVPCSPGLYPSEFRRRVRLLEWDTTTRPSDAARLRQVLR